MQRKMKPSEVGYFGKGIPDAEEMGKLQSAYAEKLLKEGYVAPAVREKLKRMQALQAMAMKGKKINEKALIEAMELATQLLPILHFKVDDVDWDG
jgi:hypothetical protein